MVFSGVDPQLKFISLDPPLDPPLDLTPPLDSSLCAPDGAEGASWLLMSHSSHHPSPSYTAAVADKLCSSQALVLTLEDSPLWVRMLDVVFSD